MSRASKFLIPVLALLLMGQGCIGGGGGSATDGGVFKTADAGETWVQMNVIPSARGIGSISGADVRVIAADPTDKSVMYIGTAANGLLYTEDSASSWRQPRTLGLLDGPVRDVDVDPTDPCTVYVVKQQRLYKTTDCLRTFDSETYVETRASVFVRRVSVDWFNPQVVWIGLSNGDVYKSSDAGKNWQKNHNFKSAISEILISQTDSRAVLVATEKNGFQKTVDGGDTWEEIKGGIESLRNANQVNAMVQTENSDTVLAATTYGILRSNDFGSTWEALKLLTSPGQVTILTLAVAPKNANRIYYAAGSTFYATMDGGVSWNTNKIPTTRIPNTMLIDPDEPSVLYIGVVQLQQ